MAMVSPSLFPRRDAREPLSRGNRNHALETPQRKRDFSPYVFSDAQDSWEKIFSGSNRGYERAQVVLYRNAVSTGCGSASSAVGPFYCPADQRVYLDLSFTRTWSAGWGRAATSRGPT